MLMPVNSPNTLFLARAKDLLTRAVPSNSRPNLFSGD